VRVVGTTYNIREVVQKYNAQEIFVAIPAEKKAAQREMLQRCRRRLSLAAIAGAFANDERGNYRF